MINTDDLKKRVDRAPYVKRLNWKSSGGEFRSTCPWHSDKNPSLANYRKDGVWMFSCHPCDKHGDVIAFVMAHDGVTFLEAVKRIKEESGITDEALPSFTFKKRDSVDALQKHVEGLKYLASRGISADFARVNELGLTEYPGIGLALAVPYNEEVVKFRAVNPANKADKFRHLKDRPSRDLLFGINSLCEFDSHVYVCESELDCLTMQAHGFSAVSVSSATTCLQKGELIIREEDLKKLQADDRKIFLALDQDAAGRACADAFEKLLPAYQVYRLEWTSPKDIGEIYQADPINFQSKIAKLTERAQNRPPKWRQQFRTVGQLESGGVQMLVEGFMPEGTCFIGALSGHGKTLIGLSLTKALTTGEPFLDTFRVPKKVPVLYLIPESSGRAFKNRLLKFGIPDDENLFLCRTLSDGPTLLLNDPLILEAVRQLKPVVILDTAVRFSTAKDENSATDNQKLVNDIITLRTAGAAAVIGIHHSPKASAEAKMSLENVLRGTGDLGAMCDGVFGIRRDETLYDNGNGPNQIEVICVKPRDFEPPKPFRVAATYKDGEGLIRSHIDERANLVAIDAASREQDETQVFLNAVRQNGNASYRDLENQTGIARTKLERIAKKVGWEKPRNKTWQPIEAEFKPDNWSNSLDEQRKNLVPTLVPLISSQMAVPSCPTTVAV